MAVAISAAQVKELREITGAGMLDCKRALEATDGDMEKAKDWLREHGMAKAASKSGRTANEGIIESYVHAAGDNVPKLGVLVELNCESDFVAKTDDFKTLAREIALQIAGASPRYVRREEVPADEVEREKAVYRSQLGDKPAEMMEKILEGKLNAFYSEICLLDQPWIRDEKRKKKVGDLVTEAVAKLGEHITVARFVRMAVGEESSTAAESS